MTAEKPKNPKKSTSKSSPKRSKTSSKNGSEDLQTFEEERFTLQGGKGSGSSLGQKNSIFRERGEDDDYISTLDFKKVVMGIKRHVVTFAITIALFSFAGWGVAWYLSHRFVADAYLVYKNDKTPKTEGGFQLQQYGFETIVEMMKLPTHFNSVKSILGLNEPVEDLMDMTSIQSLGGRSNLIKVSCKSDNPQLASDIVNTLARVQSKHSEELRRAQLQKAYEYFQTRSKEIEKEMESNYQEFAQFKVDNPHFELSSGNSRLIDEVMLAETEYQKSALEYNSHLVEYENLKREITHFPEHTIRMAVEDSPLKARIQATEMALLEARTRYAADNPKIKILESSLSELRKMLGESSLQPEQGTIYEKNPVKETLNLELMRFQGRLRSAKRFKDDLEKVVEEKKKGLESLPEQQLRYARIRHKKVAGEAEQEGLLRAIRSIGTMIALGKGDLELYQSIDPKQMLSRWDKILPLFPIFGMIGGILAAIAFAALMEATDRRLLTAKQVDLSYKIPCLQVVPDIPRFKRRDTEKELLFYTRELYEKIQLLSGNSSKSLAFVSAQEGEGKSTIAYHLALYCGKRLDERTLLLTFDSDKKFRESFPIDPPQSYLEDWLRGGVTMRDIVSSGDIDVIRGCNEDATKELLQTDAMKQFWDSCVKAYDRIIIDVPNIIENVIFSDLTRIVDSSIYVVGSIKTKCSLIETSLEALLEVGVTPKGILLNRVPSVYISDERIRAERKRRARERRRGAAAKKAE